jgi:hypothetical protein
MLLAQRLGQVVLDLRQLLLVANQQVALAGGAIQPLRLGVLVAPVGDVAQVLLDLAGRQLVAQLDEHVPRLPSTRNGFVVATQPRQGADFADLDRRGQVGLPELLEARFGLAQLGDGCLHLTLELVGHTGHPHRQCADLRVGRHGRERFERGRGAAGERRVTGVVLEEQVLETAGQRGIGQGGVLRQEVRSLLCVRRGQRFG